MSDATTNLTIKIGSTGDLAALQQARVQTEALTKAVEIGKAALASFGVGVGIAGIQAMAASVMNLGKNIVDMSARLQISTQAFQVLGVVARETGLDSESMTTILGKLHGTIDTAAESGGKAAKAFEVLGLNAKVLAQAPLERALEAIAVQVANATDKTKAYAAATEILGAKNTPKLIEMLQKLGTQGYDALAVKIDTLDAEQLKMLKDGSLAWEKMGRQIELFFARIPKAATETWAQVKDGVETMKGIFGEGLNESDFHGPGGAAPTAAASPQLAQANALIDASADQNQQDAMALVSAEAMKAAKKDQLDLEKKISEQITAGLEATKKTGAAYAETVKAATELVDPFAKEEEQADKIKQAWQAGAMSIEQANAALAVLSDAAWDKGLKLAGFANGGGGGGGGQISGGSSFDRTKENYENSKSTDSQVNPNSMTAGQGAEASLMSYATKIGSVGQQIQTTFSSIENGLQGGITKGLEGLLNKTMTLGQAFKSIWQGFVQSAISAFSTMLAQYIIKKAAMFVVDEAMAAKGLILSLAASAKSLIAWIPSAIAASISSYGMAAAIGTAAVIAVLASRGFEEGGYTGGTEGQPAGTVHGGEYVFSAPAVRNIGVATLENAHTMAKSASFGSVAGGGGGDEHHFHMHSSMDDAIRAWHKNPANKKAIVDAHRMAVRSV